MKKVLVTGGAGYIGSHTVVELTHAGYVPIILDDFSNTDERILSGLKAILREAPVVIRGNCCDMATLDAVFAEHSINAVIHFAAYKAVGESTEQPLKYYDNNINSLLQVLRCMAKHNVRDLVFSSSCTVYGQPDELPVSEATPLLPASSPYGQTKQMCEIIIRDFTQANPNTRSAMLRYFNPIGAHASGLIGELPFGTPNNLVPYITQTAAGIRSQLTIFGDDYNTPDGTCIRDFIHVSDLACAHVAALNWLSSQDQTAETFNLGQGKGNSVLELVRTFEEVSGQALPFSIGPRRAGDIEQIWAKVEKANRVLQWSCAFSTKDALRDAWRWQQHIRT
ncbi:MAG: UDP-glucose 4-epimerase GalE [Flavobacteriales bacterium]